MIIDYYRNNDIKIINHLVNIFKSRYKLQTDSLLISRWEYPYPIAAPKFLNQDQEYDYVVYLTAESNYWSQIIFQLSHELTHVVFNCLPHKSKFTWLSECLCELSSLIHIKIMFQFFLKFQPRYTIPINNYLIERLGKVNVDENDIKDFVSKNKESLEKDPTEDGRDDRLRNLTIAKYIFKSFEKNNDFIFAGFQAIEKYKNIDFDNCNTINECLAKWTSLCDTKKELQFLGSLIKVFC